VKRRLDANITKMESMVRDNSHIKLLLFPAVFLALLLYCGRNEIPQDQIIARVGDDVITVDEFKYSYEFSFSPTREGANPRKTYLDYMIKEKLLALEGYEEGYGKSAYVTRRFNQRRYLDILESFYQGHVHNKVKISEDEIQDAIKKGSVKFRLRIWPTEDLEQAQQALDEARKIGLLAYMRKQWAKKEVSLDNEKHFETDWIDFLDMRPEILDGVKDLPIGDISEPLPFDNGYALFQVLDIKREGIKVDELKRGVRRKKLMARIHDIKADRIVHDLMDSVLTPMDIRVDGQVAHKLTPLLYNWVNDGLPTGLSVLEFLDNPLPDSAKQYLKTIKKMLNEPIVRLNGGEKTVRDYFQYMDYYRRALTQKGSLEEFQAAFLTEIGSMMKNNAFVSLGEKEGFAQVDSVAKDLRLWKNKWVYEAYRADQVKGLTTTEEEEREYFKNHWRELPVADVDSTKFERFRPYVRLEVLHDKHISVLDKRLDKLYKKYPVWINEAILDSLDLDDKDNSRNISIFVRRNFSNQAAVPTVDMKWISF